MLISVDVGWHEYVEIVVGEIRRLSAGGGRGRKRRETDNPLAQQSRAFFRRDSTQINTETIGFVFFSFFETHCCVNCVAVARRHDKLALVRLAVEAVFRFLLVARAGKVLKVEVREAGEDREDHADTLW